MKQRRDIMQKSIAYKVTSSILKVLLLSLLIITCVAAGALYHLREHSLQASDALGQQSASDSARLLENQTMRFLSSQTAGIADFLDQRLSLLFSSVNMLSKAGTDIFSNPNEYPRGDISPASRDKIGHYSVQYVQNFDTLQDSHREDLALAANLKPMLYQTTFNDEVILATYIGFENGLYITAAETQEYMLDDKEYDPRQRDWYKTAVSAGKTTFTDVYEGWQNQEILITCASPIFENDTLKGVVGCDILLSKMNHLVINADLGKSGYAFVLNEHGELIFCNDKRRNTEDSFLRENYMNSESAELRGIAEKMTAAQEGIAQITDQGQDWFVAYSPIQSTGWSIATLMLVDEALKESYESSEDIFSLSQESAGHIQDAVVFALVLMGIVIVFCLIVFSIVGIKLSRKITEPLMQLDEGVKIISGGNLDHAITIKTGDEIEALALSFNKMRGDLLEQMANLKAVTAEKERIGAELDVARRIQSSMLPCIFPPFPTHPELDIYATMAPAKEVGGDFFDFFMLDEKKLAIVIADVSGKGVPAALFMVIAKTLLKNCVQTGLSPKQVMEKVNSQLCENNQAEMFVTVWLGILDISIGKLTCVNAGHEFPVIKRVGGDYELIKDKHCFVLAGMEDIRYHEYEIIFTPGDLLYLYTDGVTEATNKNNELFGTQRMIDALNTHKDASCKQLLELMRDDIEDFVDGASQADDITMLALEILPASGKAVKKMKAQLSDDTISNVSAFVEQELEEASVPMKFIAQINIVLDELISNTVHYSEATEVVVTCVVDSGRVILRITDNGNPYDPTKTKDPDITLSVQDRPIGGLGIHIVKKTMDSVDYEYHNGLNSLTLIKKIN